MPVDVMYRTMPGVSSLSDLIHVTGKQANRAKGFLWHLQVHFFGLPPTLFLALRHKKIGS